MAFWKKTKTPSPTDEKILLKNLKTRKTSKVVSSVIMIAIGILILIWPQQALEVACRVTGAALCLGGIVAVIMYFISEEKGFINTIVLFSGVVVGVLGLWLFFKPQFLVALIPIIIGLLLIVGGFVNVSEAMTIRKENGAGVMATVILAAITLALGIVILINPSLLNSIIVRLIGISLIFDGVSDIWIISRITGRVHETVQSVTAVDTTARETREETAQSPETSEEAPEKPEFHETHSYTEIHRPSQDEEAHAEKTEEKEEEPVQEKASEEKKEEE